ncbi:MAG: hypothetical protein SOR95_01050 [Sutterella sp.]|nr:hypothetical protein [Sutterella sp.]
MEIKNATFADGTVMVSRSGHVTLSDSTISGGEVNLTPRSVNDVPSNVTITEVTQSAGSLTTQASGELQVTDLTVTGGALSLLADGHVAIASTSADGITTWTNVNSLTLQSDNDGVSAEKLSVQGTSPSEFYVSAKKDVHLENSVFTQNAADDPQQTSGLAIGSQEGDLYLTNAQINTDYFDGVANRGAISGVDSSITARRALSVRVGDGKYNSSPDRNLAEGIDFTRARLSTPVICDLYSDGAVTLKDATVHMATPENTMFVDALQSEITSYTDDVDLSGASIVYDGEPVALTISSAKSIKAVDTNLSVTGRIELRADDAVDMHATQDDHGLWTASRFDIRATDTLNATGVQLNVAPQTNIVQEMVWNESTGELEPHYEALTGAEVKFESTAGQVILTQSTIQATEERTQLEQPFDIEVKSQTDALLNQSSITADDLTVTATDGEINAASADITLTGALTLNGANGLNLSGTQEDQGNFVSSVINLTTDEDLTLAYARFESTEGDITFKSNEGELGLDHVTLESKTAVTLSSADEMTLADSEVTGTKVSLNANSLDATRTTLTSTDEGVKVETTGTEGTLSLKDSTIEANTKTEVTSLTDVQIGKTTLKGSEVSVKGTAVDAQDAHLIATGGPLSVTSTSGAMNLSNAEVTSTEALTLESEGQLTATEARLSGKTLTATGTTVEAQGAHLDATDGAASVTSSEGAMNLSNAEVTSTEALTLESEGQLTATGAQLSGKTLTATGTTVDAQSAHLDATDGAASVTSNEGAMNLSNAVVTSTEALTLESEGQLTATEAQLSGKTLTATGTTVEAQGAHLDATGGAASVTSSEGAMNLSNAVVTSTEALTLESEGQLTATGAQLSGKTLTATGTTVEAQGVHMTSTDGDTELTSRDMMNLNGAQVTASGALTVDSAKAFMADNAHLQGKESNLTGATMALQGTSILSTEGDVLVKAEEGGMQLLDAHLEAEGSTTLEAMGDLHLVNSDLVANQLLVTAQGMDIQSGRLDIDGPLEMNARGAMTLSGDSRLQSTESVLLKSGESLSLDNADVFAPNVELTAQGGNLTLTGNTEIGDADPNAGRAHVALEASGDVLQHEGSGQSGLRGHELEVSSGGDILLDARATDTSAGNRFDEVTLEGVGDMALGLADRAMTTLSVNPESNGEVSGNLLVHAQRNGLVLGNPIEAQGEIGLYAKSISGSDLSALGDLKLASSLYDTQPGDGIHFTGDLSGRSVALYSNAGDIEVGGSMTSHQGDVEVYRRSTTTPGSIEFGHLESADAGTVYNGNGSITGGSGHAVDSLMLVTGAAGNVTRQGAFTSDAHVSLVMPNLSGFASRLGMDYLRDRSASGLLGVTTPSVTISAPTIKEITRVSQHNVVVPLIDFRSPTSPYFSLVAKTDLAMMSIPVTAGVDTETSHPLRAVDIAEEERKQQENALETQQLDLFTLHLLNLEPVLDSQGRWMIRDLRPKDKTPEDYEWLISQSE